VDNIYNVNLPASVPPVARTRQFLFPDSTQRKAQSGRAPLRVLMCLWFEATAEVRYIDMLLIEQRLNSILRWFIRIWVIDQAWGQDDWQYWPSSFFFACSWTMESQKFKERGQYPAILTEQAWSIKDILYGFRGNVSCGTQRVVLGG